MIHNFLLSKWLAGRNNFFVGSVLYKVFGNDEKLKTLFSSCLQPDDYLKHRLEHELQKLTDKQDALLPSPPKVERGWGVRFPESSDPVLSALRNEWLPLYQRMNYLRYELDRYEENTNEQIVIRKPMAFEILELEQKCMLIWAKRDHYVQHGQLPEVKQKKIDIPSDPILLGKMIETLKKNIRRNKSLMTKHPDNVVYPLKFKNYTQELEKLLSKINQPLS